ncbi:MAG: hypothetical protein ACR2KK_20215 [Acidimicrobiales bacterium]
MGAPGGRPACGPGPGLIVRDRDDPVFGWRYWQLSPRRLLRSVTQSQFEWPPGRVLRALCVEVGHPAPAERCNCGLYANPDLDALRQHGLCLAPQAIVLGQVALWGKVVDDEPSYRAEFAYPARLSLVVDSLADDTSSETLLEGLSAYRVPVLTTTLDEAVAGMSADMLRFQAMSRRTSGS